MEPVAWARKYLHADLVLSVEGAIGLYEIKGIKECKFISIPSHAISQLGAVRDVIVPRISVAVNSNEEMGIIKEEVNSYNGGLNPMHFSATFIVKGTYK